MQLFLFISLSAIQCSYSANQRPNPLNLIMYTLLHPMCIVTTTTTTIQPLIQPLCVVDQSAVSQSVHQPVTVISQAFCVFRAFTLLSIIHLANHLKDCHRCTIWRFFLWLLKASNYVKSLETEWCHCGTNSCCSDSFDKTYPSHLNMRKG